jgi:phage terminase small subunit
VLTPKQEKFCQCVVSGMSAKDAYIMAYNTKASEQVLYNESSKLMLREDIQKKIEDMRKPLVKAAQTTALSEREKKRAWLWNMIENATNDSDRIRAMDILNKMDSEYINIQRIEKDETPISTLDTEKLIEITKLA